MAEEVVFDRLSGDPQLSSELIGAHPFASHSSSELLPQCIIV